MGRLILALPLLLAACGGSGVAPDPEDNAERVANAPADRPLEPPASYPIGVVANAACVLDGSIYVAGGWGHVEGERDMVNRAYRFDPRANIWERLPNMPRSRCFHVCVAQGGKVWLFGGMNDGGTVAAVDVYDPKLDAWTTQGEMLTPRNRLAGVAVGDRIFLVGGMNEDGDSGAVDIFDPATGWSRGSPHPNPMHGLAMDAIGHTLVTAGGSGDPKGTWRYDTIRDEWREGAWLPEARLFASAVTIGDAMYLLGNRAHGDIPLLKYDFTKDEWAGVADASVETHRTAAVALGSFIYVIGGEAPKGGELSRVSRYDLATGEWMHSD